MISRRTFFGTLAAAIGLPWLTKLPGAKVEPKPLESFKDFMVATQHSPAKSHGGIQFFNVTTYRSNGIETERQIVKLAKFPSGRCDIAARSPWRKINVAHL